MTFAEVAVNVRLRRRARPIQAAGRPEQKEPSLGDAFHYRVPPALTNQLVEGHLVIVPFGQTRVYGIVTALNDTSPVEQVKEIESLALPIPLVTPIQIALARWMSDEYLTTPSHSLYTMLPPGLVRPTRAVYQLTDPEKPLPTDLTGASRTVAALLAHEGPLRLMQIQYRLKLRRKTIRRALRQLRRRQRVTSEAELPSVGGQTRQVRYVRLLADDDAIAAARPHLGHDSAQARVLRYLIAASDPLPSLETVCETARCSPSPVRALADKGWVILTPRQTTLVPALPPDDLAELANQKKSRAPRQAELLRYLARHPGPVAWNAVRDETGISSSVPRALEAAGLIQRVTQEPTVLLRLSSQEAESRALELCAAAAQSAVLELLRREGEPVWVSWLYAETDCSLQDLYQLEEMGLVELAGAETWFVPSDEETAPETPPPLTPDQSAAWAEIQPEVESLHAEVFVLHGVTGSGKTELYLRALAEVLAQGKQGIILVPEISLTPQTVQRFAARFPGRVAVYHSALSASQRYEVWRRSRDGHVDVVIGPRSALFLPLPRLGLIVLDEEHSTSYKQPRTPRYHARDVAIALGRLAEVPVILGSATPDLTSYHRARQGHYRLLTLPKRILAHREPSQFPTVRYASLPPVTVVDLRDELRAGNRSIFSRALHGALAETLNQNQQAILFLNRRGAATFVNCRDCGHVLQCSRCDVPLTYHSSDGRLVCHHCGRRSSPPEACPNCGGEHVRYFGIGTQRVEAAVQRHFPEARVLRWDRDAVGSRWGHERFLRAFVERQADILVGTQMVTKGLDLPLVTLVGVIAADTALHLPDFRAAERTFQLLTQVAGRAGRSPLGGRVVVQTYAPDSYAVQAAAGHDYEGFYQQELTFRQQTGYPPFYRLARLVCAQTDPDRCQARATEMHATLQRQIARLGLAEVTLIGPAPCFITRVRGRYRWQSVVRAPQPQDLLRHVSLPAGWTINVDPVSLL